MVNVKTLVKSDAKHCKAICSSARVFVNNSNDDIFVGRVRFVDKKLGVHVSTHTTNTHHATEKEALADAIRFAGENGFAKE